MYTLGEGFGRVLDVGEGPQVLSRVQTDMKLSPSLQQMTEEHIQKKHEPDRVRDTRVLHVEHYNH